MMECRSAEITAVRSRSPVRARPATRHSGTGSATTIRGTTGSAKAPDSLMRPPARLVASSRRGSTFSHISRMEPCRTAGSALSARAISRSMAVVRSGRSRSSRGTVAWTRASAGRSPVSMRATTRRALSLWRRGNASVPQSTS